MKLLLSRSAAVHWDAKGAEIAAKMARELSVQNKVEFDIGELVLGLECGGSDPTSGIAGNPSVGAASDKLIELRGTSILSETTELIGAEHLVAARCVTKEMGDKLTAMVSALKISQSFMEWTFGVHSLHRAILQADLQL